jgi:hypothetical protein
VILNLIHSNRPNVMNVRVDRVGAQAEEEEIVTGVEDRVTGRTSVTHAFRDDAHLNNK